MVVLLVLENFYTIFKRILNINNILKKCNVVQPSSKM